MANGDIIQLYQLDKTAEIEEGRDWKWQKGIWPSPDHAQAGGGRITEEGGVMSGE